MIRIQRIVLLGLVSSAAISGFAQVIHKSAPKVAPIAFRPDLWATQRDGKVGQRVEYFRGEFVQRFGHGWDRGLGDNFKAAQRTFLSERTDYKLVDVLGWAWLAYTYDPAFRSKGRIVTQIDPKVRDHIRSASRRSNPDLGLLVVYCLMRADHVYEWSPDLFAELSKRYRASDDFRLMTPTFLAHLGLKDPLLLKVGQEVAQSSRRDFGGTYQAVCQNAYLALHRYTLRPTDKGNLRDIVSLLRNLLTLSPPELKKSAEERVRFWEQLVDGKI